VPLARRGASLGAGGNRPSPCRCFSSTAEELIAATGLEARNVHSGRHLEALQYLSQTGAILRTIESNRFVTWGYLDGRRALARHLGKVKTSI